MMTTSFFSLGNYLHVLVWDFCIVIIGPKYPSHEAQVLQPDLASVVELGQFLSPVSCGLGLAVFDTLAQTA